MAAAAAATAARRADSAPRPQDQRRARCRERVQASDAELRTARTSSLTTSMSAWLYTPRMSPSASEEHLYDFKGGSLRSPPGPPRGLRALASSRPRPQPGGPTVQPPTLQLVAIGITGRQGKHARSDAVAAVQVHAHSGRDTPHLAPCSRQARPGLLPPAARTPRSASLLLLSGSDQPSSRVLSSSERVMCPTSSGTPGHHARIGHRRPARSIQGGSASARRSANRTCAGCRLRSGSHARRRPSPPRGN